MAIEITRKTTETEVCVGSGTSQALARAETLVPGAGREAIEVMLADAMAVVTSAEAQTDRLVAEGTVRCQAVYRQGSENTLRAVSAQAQLSQVFDMPGAAPGMTARACCSVEHVDAKYENGHMVFLVTVSISAQALKLSPTDIITGITGNDGIETCSEDICTCRITAETGAIASLREESTLPAALDARTALMEWGKAWVESWEADLGGIRVKGYLNIETLISSGIEGRPVTTVRNSIGFDQLVEVPEWLAGDVCADAVLTRLETYVDQGGEREDSTLVIEADIAVQVTSMGSECINALHDAYATAGNRLAISAEDIKLCTDARCVRCTDNIKGTLLLSENAPGVGNVISVLVYPNISGWSGSADSTIEGLLEATVLYMPGGSDTVASARSEMPFTIKCPHLEADSVVCLRVLSAEASTLMSDRVELRCTLGVSAIARAESSVRLINDISEEEALKKQPGIILVWPGETDSIWSIGKRYSMPIETVLALNGGRETLEEGKAVMLRQ